MCGIAGYLHDGPCEPKCVEVAATLGQGLLHRGPDAESSLNEDGLHLVHTRLRILDTSSDADQPMSSQDGRGELIYNGECYNFRELATILGLAHLRTRSDTEVLVEAFTRRGVADTLPLLRGMFALAFLDREAGRLSLARDRFGEKPLYLYSDATRILFCSELGPLVSTMRILGCPLKPDEDAISIYLTLGYIPAPLSLVDGVTKLEPGQLVEVSRGIGQTGFQVLRQAWTQAWRVEARPHKAVSLDELNFTLRSAVAEQLVADVPVGVFLSGGIDSSLITCNAVLLGHAGIETFSVGFEDVSLDESAYATDVARALGTRHHSRKMSGADALEMLSLMDTAHSEPLGDPSSLPTMFVSQLAREHVTVALSGDGGDELFGGYTRYGTFLDWSRGLRRVGLEILGGIPDLVLPNSTRVHDRLGPLLTRVRRAQAMGRQSDLDRYIALVGHGATTDRLRLEPEVSRDSARHLEGHWHSRRAPSLDTLREFDVVTYLPGDILAKVDRASMSFSLETRAPFLDPRVARLAAQLPSSVLWQGGSGKVPLRQILGAAQPDIARRPKTGFGPPIGSWLRGPLRRWAWETGQDSTAATSSGLDPVVIRETLARFLDGGNGSAYAWWAVLRLMTSVRRLGLAP